MVELEKNKKVVKLMHDYEVVVEKEYVPPITFPQRWVKTKKMDEEEMDKEILDVFRKVTVNTPLLDVNKQVPKYVKFMKELCTHKGKNSREPD